MSAQIIDGKAFAAVVRQKVAEKVSKLQAAHDIIPGLAVVLVGSDQRHRSMCDQKVNRQLRLE